MTCSSNVDFITATCGTAISCSRLIESINTAMRVITANLQGVMGRPRGAAQAHMCRVLIRRE